jgi:1-acyl-sn-glycerol-3-phosphate acyltransferase
VRPFREAARRLVVLFLRVFFGYRARGAARVPKKGPCVIVSNHPSYFDPIFVGAALGRPVYFLAWSALFRAPLLGRIVRAFGAVPLDLDRPGPAAWRAALALLRRGEVVGIFPEGGRTIAPALMNPWKLGAARLACRSGAPIVPVAICGAEDVWPPGRRTPRPGRVSVRFFEPLFPGEARRRDRERERALARKAALLMERAIRRRRRAIARSKYSPQASGRDASEQRDPEEREGHRRDPDGRHGRDHAVAPEVLEDEVRHEEGRADRDQR